MWKCIFMKRKLYDYLENSLSEIDGMEVKEHLAICPTCQRCLSQMRSLIDLAKNKMTLQPSEDFWHNFRIELDRELNARLVPEFSFKTKLGHRLKPVLLYASVLIIILTTSLYFYNRYQSLNSPDIALVNDISLLEEVTSETSLNHNEDAYIEELDLLYELNQNPT